MHDFRNMLASLTEAKGGRVSAKLSSRDKKEIEQLVDDFLYQIDENFLDYVETPKELQSEEREDDFNDWLDQMRGLAVKYAAEYIAKKDKGGSR